VSTDFLRVGKGFSLASGFVDWIENGYRSIAQKHRLGLPSRSWRFWARGAGRDILACGIVKDSSDSLGRPYPLLIIGTGPLKQWEERWNLLPFSCETTWDRIEYLAAQNPRDFSVFERDIAYINPPIPDWSEFADRIKDIREKWANSDHNATAWSLTELERRSSEFTVRGESFISLEGLPIHKHFPLINLEHLVCKSQVKDIPNATFMGGTFENTCLAFFKRPLLPYDFVRLWNVASVDPSGGNSIDP
jgi:type VI secretion system protein VasJ